MKCFIILLYSCGEGFSFLLSDANRLHVIVPAFLISHPFLSYRTYTKVMVLEFGFIRGVGFIFLIVCNCFLCEGIFRFGAFSLSNGSSPGNYNTEGFLSRLFIKG